MDKFKPVSGGDETDHSEKAVGRLIVSGGDSAANLELSEHALDTIVLLVVRRTMLDFTRRFDRPGTAASILRSARAAAADVIRLIVAARMMVHLRIERPVGQDLLERIQQSALIQSDGRIAACRS
ncbi:hypothetical protein [Novosphingobium sp.]|uniref:hypothetical protein n=1 Tax=Novosphingobium sp. TaxID=1874826 RepID=UPI003524AE54